MKESEYANENEQMDCDDMIVYVIIDMIIIIKVMKMEKVIYDGSENEMECLFWIQCVYVGGFFLYLFLFLSFYLFLFPFLYHDHDHGYVNVNENVI